MLGKKFFYYWFLKLSAVTAFGGRIAVVQEWRARAVCLKRPREESSPAPALSGAGRGQVNEGQRERREGGEEERLKRKEIKIKMTIKI